MGQKQGCEAAGEETLEHVSPTSQGATTGSHCSSPASSTTGRDSGYKHCERLQQLEVRCRVLEQQVDGARAELQQERDQKDSLRLASLQATEKSQRLQIELTLLQQDQHKIAVEKQALVRGHEDLARKLKEAEASNAKNCAVRVAVLQAAKETEEKARRLQQELDEAKRVKERNAMRMTVAEQALAKGQRKVEDLTQKLVQAEANAASDRATRVMAFKLAEDSEEKARRLLQELHEAKRVKEQKDQVAAVPLQFHIRSSQRSLLSTLMHAWRRTLMKDQLEEALKRGELRRMNEEDLEKQLRTARERLDTLGKELGELCLCPISLQPMREPMLGTDLRTYQKDIIETALETKLASPFTRTFMEKGSLRPNMLARAVVELMAKFFPNWEAATTASLRPTPPPPVRDELLQALQRRKSEEAVELLGRDVDPGVLNKAYLHRSYQMSLLHLCISLKLPKVACAVIDRPDFRRVESFSSQGILAAHMAAALNYGDVCEKIAKHFGVSSLAARTLRACELVGLDGRSVKIPQGSTAADVARLFGHETKWSQS